MPGDTFEARLVSDLTVDGRRAALAGSRVLGSVTDVISGSKTIGGIPTLGLRFDSLILENGKKIAISGELVEKGKSDTARDTAKIVGGAAVGAIIGHQVNSGSGGKIVGGILGGVIGAAVAKEFHGSGIRSGDLYGHHRRSGEPVGIIGGRGGIGGVAGSTAVRWVAATMKWMRYRTAASQR